MSKIMKPLFIALILVASVHAQSISEVKPGWHHGVFLNANASQLSNLAGQINYSSTALLEINTQEIPRFGYGAGIFVQYRWPNAPVMIQAEVGYQQYGGILKYKDNQGNYQLKLNYNYLTFGYQFKFFLHKRWMLGVGPQLGFNLSEQNLSYKSEGITSSLTDEQVEKRLKNIFKANTTLGVKSTVGFRLDERISMEASYYYGLDDDIGTDINLYDNSIRDKDNRTQVISVGFLYTIPQENPSIQKFN